MRLRGAHQRRLHDPFTVRYLALSLWLKAPVTGTRFLKVIPGADLIISCPHCLALAKVFSLISGNPFGTVTWSDGYRDAPMMPAPPRITRCHACAKCFWVSEAAPLGYVMPDAEASAQDAEWRRAPHVEPLDEPGLLQALAEGLGYTPELELELRVAIWWRGNDLFRVDDAPIGHSTSPEAIANMERFIELMKDGDETLQLFRAEAFRHLGRFHEMEETLNLVGCSDYWPAKSRLLELGKAGDRKLRKLFKDETPNPQQEI